MQRFNRKLAAWTVGLFFVVTATAAAQPSTYLPWQYGATYRVVQGNHGGYSHNVATTRYGWDFGMPHGTPVLAAAPGRVAVAADGYNAGWGITVVVCYGDGSCSRYAHLSSRAVSTGQSVAQAQPIGRVGSTGNSSGPHLHYQLENGSGTSLASRFVEAGVPPTGASVTSRNRGGEYGSTLDAQFPMDGNGVVTIAQGDGPKVPLGFNLRNSGSRVWEDVRLALVNDPPQNLRRALGWQDLNHIPGDRQRVAPGEGTQVRFQVNPEEINEPGDYPFRFRLFDVGTGQWIAGAEPSFVLRIVPGCYAAKFAGQSISPLTPPGETGELTIALRNAGSCSWRRGEVNLGTKDDEPFPYADESWQGNRNRILLTEESVAPGETGRFKASIAPAADAAPGRRVQYFAPVVDGRQWFGQHLKIYQTVFIGDRNRLPFTAAEYRVTWLRQSYANEPLARGDTARVTVTYRNDGPAVLFADGKHPVRFRGIRPQDRPSGFIDPDAPEAVGPEGVKLGVDRVDPGAEFSFTLPIKVHHQVNPGRYDEYFRPVAEGLTWFGRDDVFWPFTVK